MLPSIHHLITVQFLSPPLPPRLFTESCHFNCPLGGLLWRRGWTVSFPLAILQWPTCLHTLIWPRCHGYCLDNLHMKWDDRCVHIAHWSESPGSHDNPNIEVYLHATDITPTPGLPSYTYIYIYTEAHICLYTNRPTFQYLHFTAATTATLLFYFIPSWNSPPPSSLSLHSAKPTQLALSHSPTTNVYNWIQGRKFTAMLSLVASSRHCPLYTLRGSKRRNTRSGGLWMRNKILVFDAVRLDIKLAYALII